MNKVVYLLNGVFSVYYVKVLLALPFYLALILAFLTESCTSCTLKCFFSIYLFFYLEISPSIKLVIDAVTCSHCLDILFLRFKIKKVEFNVMNRVLFSFFKLVK